MPYLAFSGQSGRKKRPPWLSHSGCRFARKLKCTPKYRTLHLTHLLTATCACRSHALRKTVEVVAHCLFEDAVRACAACRQCSCCMSPVYFCSHAPSQLLWCSTPPISSGVEHHPPRNVSPQSLSLHFVLTLMNFLCLYVFANFCTTLMCFCASRDRPVPQQPRGPHLQEGWHQVDQDP